MPIKLKNISVAERSDPLQAHINSFLSPAKEKLKYAEERLKAACKATDLIKKNSDLPEKVSKSSDPLKTAEAKDKLSILSAAIDKQAQVNRENQQTINEYLCKQDKLRKENQLVSNGSGCLCLGKNPEKPMSTNTYSVPGSQSTIIGVAEFVVTDDNIISIVPRVNSFEITQGTLPKAIGCIQISEGKVKFISVYNNSFDVPIENIAVSLFALQRLGIDLNDTQVVIPSDNAPLITCFSSDCNIRIHGEIREAKYYLNETRFPGAKALAEKQLTFLDKIDELFCSIDDQVLLKRNKRFIEQIYGEKELLKLNLIKLFNCTEEIVKATEVTEKNVKVTKIEPGLQKDIHQPSTSAQALNQTIESKTDKVEEKIGSFNDYWQAIKALIQFFKEKNIDLSFLADEVNMILAYILQNGLTPEEKTQLQNWSIPETIIPGRGLDRENISSFAALYENDPIKTCINLLKDYSKGQGISGALKRFFSLAWNRHYVSSVNQFLTAYDRQELPDNLTVYDVFIKLRNSGAEISLLDNKSTLLNRLLFCAKLNGEESDFVPVQDFPCVLDPVIDVPNQPLVLRQQQDQVSTPIHITPQPRWVPPAIRATPPPFKDSPTGSIELLINRTKPGSYQEPSENKFLHQQVRPRSVSVTSKKNLLSSKFFIDAEKGLNPIMLLGEQRKEAGTSPCPPSPGVSGL